MAERKTPNLGNLNPIYERELNKLDVHQVKGGEGIERGQWRVGPIPPLK